MLDGGSGSCDTSCKAGGVTGGGWEVEVMGYKIFKVMKEILWGI